MVFAFHYAIAPQFDEIAWTFGDIVEAVGILFGIPIAGLGAGVAILWIARSPERR